MSKFEKWFEGQHGPRERGSAEIRTLSDNELRIMISNGNYAEVVLRERTDWDARHESALYAWQAKPVSEPGDARGSD